MRTIKTTTGAPITLDGDLLAVMEALYREVTAKRALERSFEDTFQGGLFCSAIARSLYEEAVEQVR